LLSNCIKRQSLTGLGDNLAPIGFFTSTFLVYLGQ
jgi:hypothetical protein